MRIDRLFLAVILLVGVIGGAYAYFTAPTSLKLAVGPAGGPDDKLLHAFADQLRRQRTALRLRFVPVATEREAAEALENGKADLAVVRPDSALPENGLTVAILREEAAIVVAPSGSGLTDIAGLAGKTLGVVAGHASDPALLALLLRHFDLEPPAVTILPLPRDEIVPALKSGRIDAAAIVAAPAGAVATEFARSIARAFDGRLFVMSAENPDAIVEGTSAAVVATTIPEGIWGGRPKQPDRAIATIGVTHRLMARSDADRNVIATLTETLFQMRSRLAGLAPSADDMQAPDSETSTSATLPNHPGAVDYFQREQQSFWERYGDWIYMAAFVASGFLSLAAWLGQRFRQRRRQAIDDVLDRLLAILSDARSADSLDRLGEITAEIDKLLAVAVQQARDGAADSGATSALMLALDGARAAVEDRRGQIAPLPSNAPRRDIAPRFASAS